LLARSRAAASSRGRWPTRRRYHRKP
jgi:hypothetical protein